MDDLVWSIFDHHPSLRLALVVIAYLDLSLRLRFVERVVRLRKVFEVSVLGRTYSVRERWFRITTLLDFFRRRKRIVLDNGHGHISEQNLKHKLTERKGRHG
jgi:hypothetical protein